jgi:hypothetical protein
MRSTAESRRRHLRWRQSAIFTALVAAVAFAGVMAYGMWRGDLATMFDADFKSPPSPSAEPLLIPCPSSGQAVYLEPTAVTVHVLNGSGETGQAAEAVEVLAAQGFPEPTAGNAARYQGLVKLVAGVQGVDAAYTLLQFSPDGSVIVLDPREDASVDMVLGTEYDALPSDEEIVYEPASAIQPLDGCRAVEELIGQLPAPSPTPVDPSAPTEAAAARR